MQPRRHLIHPGGEPSITETDPGALVGRLVSSLSLKPDPLENSFFRSQPPSQNCDLALPVFLKNAIFGRRCGPPHDWAPGPGANTPFLIIISQLIIHPLVGKNVWSWIAVSLSHDQRLTSTRCGLHIVRTRAQPNLRLETPLGS